MAKAGYEPLPQEVKGGTPKSGNLGIRLRSVSKILVTIFAVSLACRFYLTSWTLMFGSKTELPVAEESFSWSQVCLPTRRS